MSKFEFNKDALNDVNIDSDLFYDLVYGGYIDPFELLVDSNQAEEIIKAGQLLARFFEALENAVEERETDDE